MPPIATTAGVQSFAVIFDEPLDWTAFGVWASLLLHRHGADILRLKGLLNVARGADARPDQRRPTHRPSAEPPGSLARCRSAFAPGLHRARIAARAYRALARDFQWADQ